MTDAQRLQQILRNLLSNAVKFTDAGAVTLHRAAAPGRALRRADAAARRRVVAFTVRRHRHRHPEDKLALIFEAFQQADGTTSRKYGGTGLGLSISRELARLLGGAITVVRGSGAGSTFTLYLPDIAGRRHAVRRRPCRAAARCRRPPAPMLAAAAPSRRATDRARPPGTARRRRCWWSTTTCATSSR